jgi:multiple sugar transport system permease protein
MKLQTKHILVLPLTIFLTAFVIFPTIYLWYLAFNKVTFTNIDNPVFCGIENFIEALGPTVNLLNSILFSFKFAIVAVIVQLLVGLGLAILFNRDFKGKSIFLTLLLVPMLTSSAMFGVVGRLLFNAEIGTATYFINLFSRFLNMYILPLSKDWVFPTLIYLDTVNWAPFIFLMVYTDLRSLPREYIEAALIDGASSRAIYRYIVLPYLKPLLGVLAVIRFADAFKTFDIIYTLTGGGPGSLTTSYSIKVYELVFVKGNFGLGAAASLIGFFILIVPLSLVIVYTRRRWTK